jgi:hypothetical protein
MKKNTCVPLLLLLSVCLSASVTAQEMSHLYGVYGFQLPLLEKGEYVLSASFNGRYGKATTHYLYTAGSPALEWDGIYEYSQEYARLSGVLAITDNLLAEVSMVLYPSQETRVTTSGMPESRSEERGTESTALSPTFMLVFRPKANIECFGRFYTENLKTTYEQTPTSDWTAPYDKSTYSSFSVGVSYFGKL